ncbi:MAG TPA: zinc ribbon domain-containing protein, partial [Methanomassiliicoccales archaeon]|nr:zinc ribbon domain-containing protein [Methanomassiliicoccales archaeon]
FGSAAFVSVFGSVFALSGGLVMMGDFRHRTRAGMGFRAAAGNKEFKAALKPTGSFGRMAKERSEDDEELKGEVLAAQHDTSELSGPSGEVCPNCSSPVMGNWKLCPICGAELE